MATVPSTQLTKQNLQRITLSGGDTVIELGSGRKFKLTVNSSFPISLSTGVNYLNQLECIETEAPIAKCAPGSERLAHLVVANGTIFASALAKNDIAQVVKQVHKTTIEDFSILDSSRFPNPTQDFISASPRTEEEQRKFILANLDHNHPNNADRYLAYFKSKLKRVVREQIFFQILKQKIERACKTQSEDETSRKIHIITDELVSPKKQNNQYPIQDLDGIAQVAVEALSSNGVTDLSLSNNPITASTKNGAGKLTRDLMVDPPPQDISEWIDIANKNGNEQFRDAVKFLNELSFYQSFGKQLSIMGGDINTPCLLTEAFEELNGELNKDSYTPQKPPERSSYVEKLVIGAQNEAADYYHKVLEREVEELSKLYERDPNSISADFITAQRGGLRRRSIVGIGLAGTALLIGGPIVYHLANSGSTDPNPGPKPPDNGNKIGTVEPTRNTEKKTELVKGIIEAVGNESSFSTKFKQELEIVDEKFGIKGLWSMGNTERATQRLAALSEEELSELYKARLTIHLDEASTIDLEKYVRMAEEEVLPSGRKLGDLDSFEKLKALGDYQKIKQALIDDVFIYFAVYLEREPSDEYLKGSIDHFLKIGILPNYLDLNINPERKKQRQEEIKLEVFQNISTQYEALKKGKLFQGLKESIALGDVENFYKSLEVLPEDYRALIKLSIQYLGDQITKDKYAEELTKLKVGYGSSVGSIASIQSSYLLKKNKVELDSKIKSTNYFRNNKPVYSDPEWNDQVSEPNGKTFKPRFLFAGNAPLNTNSDTFMIYSLLPKITTSNERNLLGKNPNYYSEETIKTNISACNDLLSRLNYSISAISKELKSDSFTKNKLQDKLKSPTFIQDIKEETNRARKAKANFTQTNNDILIGYGRLTSRINLLQRLLAL